MSHHVNYVVWQFIHSSTRTITQGKLLFLIASLPTEIAAIISKSLLVMVIVGVISLTVLHLI